MASIRPLPPSAQPPLSALLLPYPPRAPPFNLRYTHRDGIDSPPSRSPPSPLFVSTYYFFNPCLLIPFSSGGATSPSFQDALFSPILPFGMGPPAGPFFLRTLLSHATILYSNIRRRGFLRISRTQMCFCSSCTFPLPPFSSSSFSRWLMSNWSRPLSSSSSSSSQLLPVLSPPVRPSYPILLLLTPTAKQATVGRNRWSSLPSLFLCCPFGPLPFFCPSLPLPLCVTPR